MENETALVKQDPTKNGVESQAKEWYHHIILTGVATTDCILDEHIGGPKFFLEAQPHLPDDLFEGEDSGESNFKVIAFFNDEPEFKKLRKELWEQFKAVKKGDRVTIMGDCYFTPGLGLYVNVTEMGIKGVCRYLRQIAWDEDPPTPDTELLPSTKVHRVRDGKFKLGCGHEAYIVAQSQDGSLRDSEGGWYSPGACCPTGEATLEAAYVRDVLKGKVKQ